MASAPSTDITVYPRPTRTRPSARLAKATRTSASPKAAWAATQAGPCGIAQAMPETTPAK
jgi:hypothetical protein